MANWAYKAPGIEYPVIRGAMARTSAAARSNSATAAPITFCVPLRRPHFCVFRPPGPLQEFTSVSIDNRLENCYNFCVSSPPSFSQNNELLFC